MKFSIVKDLYYTKRQNIIIILFIKTLIILLYLYILINIIQNQKDLFNINDLKNNNIIKKKYCTLPLDIEQNILKNLIINISYVSYSFSYKFHMAKFEYNFGIYDINKNLIIPSNLTLHFNLHIFCQSTEIKNNINIKSIANVYLNKFYNCIEYFHLDEKNNFGITIYNIDKHYEFHTIYLFYNYLINFNNIFFQNDKEYDPYIIINRHILLEKTIDTELNNSNINNKTHLLKQSYLSIPNFSIKSNFARKYEIWYFKNIYEHYFCYCKYEENSKCLYKNITKKCKYKLYLNIIDNSKNLYNKNDYFLADFSSPDTAPCEAYIIFKEMIKQNLNAYFMTQREDIFKEYSSNIMYFKRNPIIYGSNYIDGDFLEKYLDIFLKLKATISGAKIYSYDNLFYNIEYITYICLGHGISLLKDFLYEDYYSFKIYNKIILPNSQIILSNAMKYGWINENIIRFGLPRWDIFNNSYNIKYFLSEDEEIQKNSIFAMFTWRDIKKYKKISKYYFKNIFSLINNIHLIENLKINNITFYFSLHHNMEEYKYLVEQNKYIKYIKQEKIIGCLSISQLVITDFSSILFDIMVRNKPFIIFVPDSEDPTISKTYNKTYFNIINNLKNGILSFENTFFNINETLKKINFYINNNFQLDEKLKNFYSRFNFQGGKNTINIINYLKGI